ncbi:DUF1294 domain-containing protein [Qipengyuania soli]|uniref:DUF1294 domain-containing protein n=1 Tax=Qipengyuania soli TaxID=2782568 RepID=A0A7S8IUE3_9SPHN|nr:DUF1294 domain-containing protein [Qipengyuania soli]QPC98929.1 DUF1294 domain-containing protein [Qipengyuania soli]
MTEYFAYFLIAMNFAAFAMFGIDKARSEAGEWRIRESTLLTLALFGGLPGALAGRSLFRHKTRKKSFNEALRLVMLLYLLAMLYILYISLLSDSPMRDELLPNALTKVFERS